MKLRLLFISIIAILFIALALNTEKNYKIEKYIENKTAEHMAMYNSVYYSFKKRADMAYDFIKEDKTLVDIYKKLQNADEKQKEILRDKLNSSLLRQYNILKRNGTEIFHFHTKKNHSFFRFQRPWKYGDDLTEIRKTVVYVNQHKRPIDGFEVGIAFSGYRFVYPIKEIETKEHLGSVEFSFNLELFVSEFMNTLGVFSNVMINKEIVDKKFKKDDIEKKYRTVHVDNYYTLKDINTLCDEDIAKNIINHHIDTNTVIEGIKSTEQNKAVSIFDNHSQNLITFLPIQNPITKKNCGFMTIKSDDKYIRNKRINTYFIFTFLSLFVIAGALFTYRETKRQKDISKFLQNEVDKKTKELKEINENLEARVEKEVKENLQYKISLYEKAKLASIGDMIANIAHQWRQPLTSMSTIASSTIINKELGLLNDKQLIDYMEKIISNTKYLSETISTFRNYIKEDKETVEAILQERIDIALNITDTVLKDHNIELITDLEDEPIKIRLVVGELTQVIINILTNAKDALLENNIKEPWIKLILKKENDTALITVEDNAGGIPQDVLPKIFDQYFTTKDEETGTGLGLHMSHQIIEESFNGKLYVKNTDNGAKFFIEIPL